MSLLTCHLSLDRGNATDLVRLSWGRCAERRVSECVCSFRDRGRLTLMMWLWNRAGAQRRLSLRPSKFICYVGSACSCMHRTPLCPCGFPLPAVSLHPMHKLKQLVRHGKEQKHMLNPTWLWYRWVLFKSETRLLLFDLCLLVMYVIRSFFCFLFYFVIL